jgi:TetR/AcrR family transcriptional regulator, ethionamide resistance regulator
MPSITRKPQAKRQERREQIERRLLDATERLMRDGASFTELSVDRLSTEAGMSRASFYIYLADSAELWWGVAWRHDANDVRAAMAGIVASYRRHQPVLVALNEMAGYDPLVAATYRELLTGISGRLTQVIENGQSDGSIRRELPAATTASALSWMVERACQQNLPNSPPGYDAELTTTLTEIAWAALYLAPTAKS